MTPRQELAFGVVCAVFAVLAGWVLFWTGCWLVWWWTS